MIVYDDLSFEGFKIVSWGITYIDFKKVNTENCLPHNHYVYTCIRWILILLNISAFAALNFQALICWTFYFYILIHNATSFCNCCI